MMKLQMKLDTHHQSSEGYEKGLGRNLRHSIRFKSIIVLSVMEIIEHND